MGLCATFAHIVPHKGINVVCSVVMNCRDFCFLQTSEGRLVHFGLNKLHLLMKLTWRDWSPTAAAERAWACLSRSLAAFSLLSKYLHSESYAAIAVPSVRRHKKICESILKFFTVRSANDVAVYICLWNQRLAQTSQISRIFGRQIGFLPANA